MDLKMKPYRKQLGCLPQILIASLVPIVIIVWFQVKEYFYRKHVEKQEIALVTTCFEFGELIKKEPKAYLEKYIQLEGVLLNIEHADGGSYIYFTSGFQTDTSYLVGKPVLWTKFSPTRKLSECDSTMLVYGKLYNIQEAAQQITFAGDLINDDSLTHFKYIPACEEHTRFHTYYSLENFCMNKVVVKARLDQITQTDEGIKVDLSNVLIISKTRNQKTIFNN